MKLFKSFAFAFNGLKICFTSETNFKIHVLLAAVAILLGVVFSISTSEWHMNFKIGFRSKANF